MLLFKSTILVALLAAITSGTPVAKRHEKYIAYPVERGDASIKRRYEQGSFDGFQDGRANYFTNLKLGSNKQEVSVMIDTGSSLLNIPQTGSQCLGGECANGVAFDPNESTTFKNLSKFTKGYYGGGGAVYVTGFQSTDDFYFDGGKKLPNFEFTLLNHTFYARGLLGIAPSTDTNTSYVESVKKAGYINKAGFSLYTTNDQQGTFLLGGVDKAKFEGELAIYNSKLSIPAKSLTTANGSVLDFPAEIQLDSGSSGIIIDPVIVDQINKEVSGKDGKISCDIALSGDKKFTFDLGQGVKIDVPYSDAFYWNADKTKCGSRISKTTAHYTTQNVGIPLIKHTYLTHNYETGNLGVAPVKHTDESNIVDFWF
ncbi:hypothetical protein KGF57_004374 [Candida theae]|uniref:Peptidase A1 domain-containing protein n=1 Tax=Candida theae TaxID=1198502 RepID=A0AAD5BBR7_9ASCO|nr:uncharacterized protein KGF57_004374 [Candida theae]KAI5950207.1 hypothetical protein KGF57_004374 [Candida theae]